MKEIIAASATAIAKAIRERDMSSEEVVDACLERVRAVNPVLNAVVQQVTDAAREQARAADFALARGELLGPLHGVPMTIKDTLETAGVICTGDLRSIDLCADGRCCSGRPSAQCRSDSDR